MTSITWAGPKCVQEAAAILGPQNRIQGRCGNQPYLVFPNEIEIIVCKTSRSLKPPSNEGSLLTNISILGEALPQNFFDTFAVYSVADEPVTNSDSRR